jgi:hypothetical protein
MQSLIEVFRMNELSKEVRTAIIIQLGAGINNQLGGNYTEALVYELVKVLDPENKILKAGSHHHYYWVKTQEGSRCI